MDSFLLTPYLLDRPEPLLRGLLRPEWRVNEPAMPGGAVLESAAALAEGIAEHVRGGLEHLDPDLIDPVEAPAMLYPAVGGPGVAALATAVSALAARARVTSVSLTGWALDLDGDGTTARAVERVLAAALAGARRSS